MFYRRRPGSFLSIISRVPSVKIAVRCKHRSTDKCLFFMRGTFPFFFFCLFRQVRLQLPKEHIRDVTHQSFYCSINMRIRMNEKNNGPVRRVKLRATDDSTNCKMNCRLYTIIAAQVSRCRSQAQRPTIHVCQSQKRYCQRGPCIAFCPTP